MAKKTTPKPKKEFKLKPCSDPTRDDWSVLSKLLKRPVSPEGMNEPQAKLKLEQLLIEAYAKNCDQMVTAACHSRSKSAGNKSYLQTIFDALGRNPARRLDFYETIRTRLLLPEDGRDRPVAKGNVEKGKGSSYRMLEYWEADKMGILPYIRARVTHIIQGMKEEIQAKNLKVSLDAHAAANTGIQIDSDGMGRLVRQKTSDFAEGADSQEIHDGGHDVDENSRFALPSDEEAAELSEFGGGHSDGMSPKVAKLSPSHNGVKVLERLLDSMLSDESINNSPLFDAAFVETLSENEVTLGSFKELAPLMAEHGKPESADELQARVSAELSIAREIVTNLGGVHRFPEEVATRMTEAMRELAPDDDAGLDEGLSDRSPDEISNDRATEDAGREAEPMKIGQTSDQRLAYAFGQTRKHLLAFDKANRPEFELFSLVLGTPITPAESPEARSLQLRECAQRIAKERCQGMNTEDDRAIGVTIENAVAEWDPSTSGFGRRFPDVLEHLETEAARALEQKANDAIAAAQARLAAKAEALPEMSTTVEQGGQISFLPAMLYATGAKTAAFEALKETPEDEVRSRRLVSMDRDARTIEEIIRTPEMQHAFAVRNALETDFWTGVCCDPEDLHNAERVDYRFLCAKLDIKPDHDLADAKLHAEMKSMASKWVSSLISAREKAGRLRSSLNLETGKVPLEVQFNRDLTAAVESYNPAEDGFLSQALNEFLRNQLEQDVQRRKRGPRTPAPVSTEESVAMHVMAAPPHSEANIPVAVAPKGGKDDYQD